MTATQRENLQKVISALRSGEYTQTRGRLSLPWKPNCFCVEGVICELYRQEHPESRWKHDTGTFFAAEGDGGYGSAPLTVMAWAGLSALYHDAELLRRNDHGGQTFAQLADYLESEFLQK